MPDRTRWTGKVGMVGVDTVDARRIEPDGLSLPGPVPLRTLPHVGVRLDQVVGEITEISRAEGGELRGAGWVDASLLPAGRRTFACGLEVDIVRYRIDPPEIEPTDVRTGSGGVFVVVECRVSGLAVYLDPDMTPAWPGCEITLAD